MDAPARLPNRREAEQHTLTLLGRHIVSVTIGRDNQGNPTEVFFVERGKVGQGLDELLSELGMKVSRAMQNRNPETGEDLQ